MAAATRVRYVTLPIEQLVARGGGEMGDGGGQFVLARDQHDPAGPLVRRRIGRTYERTAHHLRVVGIRDGEGREQTVRVTDEHPFFVAGRGWTKAHDLAAGDRLLGAAGEASTVSSNLGEDHPEGVTVYNLEVEDDHTYFVRAEGSDGEPVWVHNAIDYSEHGSLSLPRESRRGVIRGAGGPGKVYEIPASELVAKKPYIGKTRQATVADRMRAADHRAKTPTGNAPRAITLAEDLTVLQMDGIEAILIHTRGLKNLSNVIPGLNLNLDKNAARIQAGKRALGLE